MTGSCPELNIRKIVDVMSEGVVVQLADGHICAANPSAVRILGYSQEQLTRMSTNDLAWHATREDGSTFLDGAHHPSMLALRTGKSHHNVVMGLDRPDGEQIWVSINAEPLFNQNETTPYAVVTTFADVTRIKQHERKIEELNALISAIRLINEHLLTASTEEELYRFICNTLYSLEHVSTVWIELCNQDMPVTPVAWAGIDGNLPPAADRTPAYDLLNTAICNRKSVIIEDLSRHASSQTNRRDAVSAAAIPLFVDGEAMGGIAIIADHPAFFNETNTKFLSEVAGDIAVGLKTLRLDHKLQTTLSHLRDSLNATIDAISGIVEYRDPYTAGHERRVAQLACAIGEKMGLPERQIEGLRVAGHIHDLGKIAVPAEILSKPSRLTDAERRLVMEHPLTGYNLLKNLQFPWPIAQVVLQHHERLDGSGYPQKLVGDEIIFEAKVLMVADVVEAIAGHRPYRPALGAEPALLEIRKNRGRYYESDVVDACLDLFAQKQFAFEERPSGLM